MTPDVQYAILLSIATILSQLNKEGKPLKVAVFLLVGLLLSPVLYKSTSGSATTEQGILGGPIDQTFSPSNIILETASAFGEGSPLGANSFQVANISLASLPGSLGDETYSSGDSSREDLLSYRVQKGDTLSGIASYFGVSIDTIVNANPKTRARFLNPGDELNILPTSGSVYTAQDGDTLESIANYFGISEDSVQKFNKSVNFNTLSSSVRIVIPGARGYAISSNNSLLSFNNNFIIPADGFNWGRIHHYNAVDISNSCGTRVSASAEGLVVPDESFGDGKGGWNGGYGSFVLIEHPFGDGVRTRYAHLSKVFVDIGDYVKQGEQIGVMGESGDATGCHVHFEVYGAQNPFVK